MMNKKPKKEKKIKHEEKSEEREEAKPAAPAEPAKKEAPSGGEATLTASAPSESKVSTDEKKAPEEGTIDEKPIVVKL